MYLKNFPGLGNLCNFWDSLAPEASGCSRIPVKNNFRPQLLRPSVACKG